MIVAAFILSGLGIIGYLVSCYRLDQHEGRR